MITKNEKAILKAEFEKVWGTDSKMIKYEVESTSNYAILPDGKIITIPKYKVNTRFCFGESGYDYEDAQNMARHARTSESYFKAENMKKINQWISDLEEVANGISINSKYIAVIYLKAYWRQPENCNLVSLHIEKAWNIFESFNDNLSINELSGKTTDYGGQMIRVLTVEEVKIILDTYRKARAEHEKKIDAYLKRYSTSKVHSWTYWIDA